MDNRARYIVPKPLLFVMCWQFNQLSCLPSSIFNGFPPKYATHSFVWEGCLHIVMPLNILYFPMLLISLPPALFSCDTSEMVPMATPPPPEEGESEDAAIIPSTPCWQCQSLMQQLLPAQISLAPLWFCFPAVAATELTHGDPETRC